MATILFVDDDEMERTFAREILEPRGHRVLYAGDGETALKVFSTESVDVVVTDLAMPKLNGLRLIKKLRADDPRVHVIAASGINADQLDLAEDLGAIAVLQKPWDPRKFLDTLTRILTTEQASAAEYERVWPTIQSGTQFDEEGRMITPEDDADEEGIATQDDRIDALFAPDDVPTSEKRVGSEKSEDPEETVKPAKPGKSSYEGLDLGLDDVELELEDPEE